MGKIIKNGISYTTSSDVALNINYDNSTSGIAAGTVQAALDELAVGVNGILISVPAAGWVEGSESGTYTNTIEVLDLSGNIALDCYIENNATDEAKNFFDTKITLIETEDGLIIFTATEAYAEDFNILLKGNVGAAVGNGSGSGESVPTVADIVVELPLENWVAEEDGDYSQTVELEAVTAEFNPIVLLSYEGEEPTNDELSSYACIKAINVSEGIIKFIASEKPIITFSVIVKGMAADVTELKNYINTLEEKVVELENKNVELEGKVTELEHSTVTYDDLQIVWEGTTADWATTQYLTIALTDAQYTRLTEPNYEKVIAFIFGTGNQNVGSPTGNIWIVHKTPVAIGAWNAAFPLYNGKLVFMNIDTTTKSLRVWCDASPGQPLRKILLG